MIVKLALGFDEGRSIARQIKKKEGKIKALIESIDKDRRRQPIGFLAEHHAPQQSKHPVLEGILRKIFT